MRIIQAINSLPYGAALTNDALNIKRILEKAGCNTSIYANHIDPELPKGSAFPFEKMEGLKDDDIVIFHPNLRAEDFTDQVSRLPCRKMIRHHVFTPFSFSSNFSDDVEYAVKTGNQVLRSTAKNFEYILAPSRFDMQEMRSLGYKTHSYGIVPYLIEPRDYLQGTAASPDIVAKYADGYTNILYVSRIVPNKKQEDAIAAFAYYKKYFNNKSRLILPGNVVYEPYYHDLVRYCSYLNLKEEDVIFPGLVSFPDLMAYYQIADVFLFSSEHEGFGIPLIEAMLFNIPIIAYNFAAVPDTLKGGGILLPQKDPVVTAYWIERLTRDWNLRNKLISGYSSVIHQYDIISYTDALLCSLGEFIKSILADLPREDYIDAMRILSGFDSETAGLIWR